MTPYGRIRCYVCKKDITGRLDRCKDYTFPNKHLVDKCSSCFKASNPDFKSPWYIPADQTTPNSMEGWLKQWDEYYERVDVGDVFENTPHVHED